MKNNVILIAPFWNRKNHVGCLRVLRFIEYLKDEYDIVLISSGVKNNTYQHSWGLELSITDPFRLYPNSEDSVFSPIVRKENNFRRRFAYWMFNPDPTIVWVHSVIYSKEYKNISGKVDFVISTSPPESSHVLALKLSQNFNCKLIVDLRDGWLDDPLKNYLQKFSLRKIREARVEKKIYNLANKILVTSDYWEKLLLVRFPYLKNKVYVISNGYPIGLKAAIKENIDSNKSIHLIHAGRFTKSRASQKVTYALKPFTYLSGERVPNVNIELIGDLSHSDIEELNNFTTHLDGRRFSISHRTQLVRELLFNEMSKADGFILLSYSKAAVPSKFFEYLLFGKPILTITPQFSGLWEISKNYDQIFLFDITSESELNIENITRFIKSCEGRKTYRIPADFKTDVLKKKFLKTLQY